MPEYLQASYPLLFAENTELDAVFQKKTAHPLAKALIASIKADSQWLLDSFVNYAQLTMEFDSHSLVHWTQRSCGTTIDTIKRRMDLSSRGPGVVLGRCSIQGFVIP